MRSYVSKVLFRFLNNMMCKYCIIILLGILFISCTDLDIIEEEEYIFDKQKNDFILYSGWGFSIQVPKMISVDSQQCIDFWLYQFMDTSASEKKDLLSAFAGNHPDFASLPAENPQIKSLRIHGMKAKLRQWGSNDGLQSSEVLIELPKNVADGLLVPEFVHFWYQGISAEEKKIVDEIIMSIRALPPETK